MTKHTGHGCDWVGDRLPDYHGGRLAVEQRRSVEAHLAACPACARESALVADLRRVPVPAPPDRWDRLVDDVVERAFHEAARRPALLRTPFLRAAAVILFAAGLSGLWWWAERPQPEASLAVEEMAAENWEALQWSGGLPWGESQLPGWFTLDDLSASELEALLDQVEST